jgi:hypothetical protein
VETSPEMPNGSKEMQSPRQFLDGDSDFLIPEGETFRKGLGIPSTRTT